MDIQQKTNAAIQSAVADYEEGLRHLSPGGRPLYAPDIMAEKSTAIRAAYLAELARLEDTARAAGAAAESTLADGRRDPYSWLTDSELQRATLLAPFVKEDIEHGMVTSPAGDRAHAWLIWRAAVSTDNPNAEQLERAAWPDALHAAAETIIAARAAMSAIDFAQPDYEAGVRARYGIVDYPAASQF